MRKLVTVLGLAVALAVVTMAAPHAAGWVGSGAAGPEAVQQQPAEARAPSAAEVSGKYEGTSDTPEGAVKTTAEFQLVDGKLTASLQATGYMLVVQEATIKGAEITIQLAIDGNPAIMKGTWKDGVIDGYWSMYEATGTFALRKIKT
jgi:hypothetical protein